VKLFNVKHLLIITLILCMLAISGCSSHPAGLSSPRGLTTNEKDVITGIGTEAVEIPANVNLTVELTWSAIVWQGAEKQEIHYLRTDVPLMNAFDNVPAAASWYPTAIISTGENGYMAWVVIDLTTKEVVDVFTKTQPTIP
jgi:hypothetical protein